MIVYCHKINLKTAKADLKTTETLKRQKVCNKANFKIHFVNKKRNKKGQNKPLLEL